MDKKTLIIIILSIALCVVGYIAFKPTPISREDKIIDEQLKELADKNNGLVNDIARITKEKARIELKNDSLEKSKSKIKIEYVYKYKEIDNANVPSVVNDFQGVFTDNGVKWKGRYYHLFHSPPKQIFVKASLPTQRVSKPV